MLWFLAWTGSDRILHEDEVGVLLLGNQTFGKGWKWNLASGSYRNSVKTNQWNEFWQKDQVPGGLAACRQLNPTLKKYNSPLTVWSPEIKISDLQRKLKNAR